MSLGPAGDGFGPFGPACGSTRSRRAQGRAAAAAQAAPSFDPAAGLPSPPWVPGRQRECAQLDQLLRTVRGGGSRTLVIRGEPGVGLPDEDARALLRATIPDPWDEHVRGRIVAETRGNPLALLELPEISSPVELAGGFGLPIARPVDTRIRAAYLRRTAELPADTRRLLLIAVADPTGEPALLWSAAGHLGIHVAAAERAVATGLVTIGERVGFAHSIVRAAVYRAVDPEDRRGAHRALAAATDPTTGPDRRTWHAACGASGPDGLGPRRIHRGRSPYRNDRSRLRRTGPPHRGHPAQRHRLGRRYRGPLPCSPDRRPGSRKTVSGSDLAARPHQSAR